MRLVATMSAVLERSCSWQDLQPPRRAVDADPPHVCLTAQAEVTDMRRACPLAEACSGVAHFAVATLADVIEKVQKQYQSALNTNRCRPRALLMHAVY